MGRPITVRLIPRRRREIDDRFARVIAGQVAAGLTHGSGASPRVALTAIGVMLANATRDPVTHDTLTLAGRLTATPQD